MKLIQGFDYHYVTEEGKVISMFKGNEKEMKQRLNGDGYPIVSIREQKRAKVHRLVAEAFIPNPNQLPQVNHIDGIKTNNHVSNLEWVNNSQNQKHAWDIGLQKRRTPKNAVFSPSEIQQIIDEYQTTETSQRKLAEKYDCSKTTIADILNGRYYNHDKTRASVSKEKTPQKLTFEQAEKIRAIWDAEQPSYNSLGKRYGVNHKTIKKIIDGKSYVQ